jgi:hypothetical protein
MKKKGSWKRNSHLCVCVCVCVCACVCMGVLECNMSRGVSVSVGERAGVCAYKERNSHQIKDFNHIG